MMANNNQTNYPWTIMDGARGIPKPPDPPLTLPYQSSLGTPYMPDVTNGQYLAVPNLQPQLAGTAVGLNVPAQPLTPQIYGPSAPPPDPTLDQIAMSPMFNISGQQLQDMQSAANIQTGAQIASKFAAGLGIANAFPAGAPREIAHAAGLLYDLYDGSQFRQDAQDRYNDMLWQQLNDRLSQRVNNGQLPQGDLNR